MFVFLKFLLLATVVVVGGAIAYWTVQVPQPLRHDVKIAYFRDAVIYTYQRMSKPPAHDDLRDVIIYANEGNLYAQTKAGQLLFDLGAQNPENYAQAVHYLSFTAEMGLPIAQNAYGIAKRYGLGTNQNVIEAYKWLKLSADTNYPLAKKNLFDLSRQLTTRQIDDGVAASKQWIDQYRKKDISVKFTP